jgi:hypothetical protein
VDVAVSTGELPATTTQSGFTRLATSAEASNGTLTTVAVTPAGMNATIQSVLISATNSTTGLVRFATEDEALAGMLNNVAMSPSTVNATLQNLRGITTEVFSLPAGAWDELGSAAYNASSWGYWEHGSFSWNPSATVPIFRSVPTPQNWDSSVPLRYRLAWTSDNGTATNTVEWGVACWAVGDGDTLSNSTTPAFTKTVDVLQAQKDIHFAPVKAITPQGDLSAGNTLLFALQPTTNGTATAMRPIFLNLDVFLALDPTLSPMPGTE